MAKAIESTVTSIFASSLTTFAGFLVLILMRFGLGRDIGLVMSKGVLLGLISTVVVLPPMLLLSEKWVNKFNHKVLLPSFDKTANFTLKYKKLYLLYFWSYLYQLFMVQITQTFTTT